MTVTSDGGDDTAFYRDSQYYVKSTLLRGMLHAFALESVTVFSNLAPPNFRSLWLTAKSRARLTNTTPKLASGKQAMPSQVSIPDSRSKLFTVPGPCHLHLIFVVVLLRCPPWWGQALCFGVDPQGLALFLRVIPTQDDERIESV